MSDYNNMKEQIKTILSQMERKLFIISELLNNIKEKKIIEENDLNIIYQKLPNLQRSDDSFNKNSSSNDTNIYPNNIPTTSPGVSTQISQEEETRTNSLEDQERNAMYKILDIILKIKNEEIRKEILDEIIKEIPQE